MRMPLPLWCCMVDRSTCGFCPKSYQHPCLNYWLQIPWTLLIGLGHLRSCCWIWSLKQSKVTRSMRLVLCILRPLHKPTVKSQWLPTGNTLILFIIGSLGCSSLWREFLVRYAVSIRRDSYLTQTTTTEGTNVCLKDLGPWTSNKGLLHIWTSLGFSTNPKTHFVTP